ELLHQKSLANALRMLNFKFFTEEQKTFPFESFRADFQMKKGTLNTRNLIIRSRLGSVSYVGKINLPDDSLDGYLGLHTFEKSNQVLDSIPIVGTMVAWPYRGLTTTYFSVKGPNENPSVSLVPFHELRKSLLSIFANMFETYPKDE